MAITAEALLAQRFGVRDYEVPGLGIIRVRPLTRAEALAVVGKKLDQDVMEQQLLSKAVVEPKLTESDIRTWQANSPAGELGDLVLFVQQISGLAEGAAKSGVPDPGSES